MARKNPHAVALGRRGGKVSSPAKTQAVRQNAQLGGRRPKHVSPALWRQVIDRARNDGMTMEQLVPALYRRYVERGLAPATGCGNSPALTQRWMVRATTPTRWATAGVPSSSC